MFGSRSKNLRDVMLGEDCPLPLDVSKKRPRGSKSSKRDSKSSRTVNTEISFSLLLILVKFHYSSLFVLL